MKRKRELLLASLLAVLVSMTGYARVAEPGVKKKRSEADTPFYTLEKGTKSGIKTAEQFAIKEEEDWLSLWRRHRAGSLESIPTPSVDFEYCMVVAVFQGESSTKPGLLEIERVRTLPDKVVVTVREWERDVPVSGRGTTSSFHIVKTARSALPVVFN